MFRATWRGTYTVPGMWVFEMWHGLALVLGLAFGIAAVTGLSCVAMAGLDADDDEDPTYAEAAGLSASR